MNDTNLVVITGGLVRDIDLKYTPRGTAVADFSLACTGSDKVGEQWKERVDYFDCVVFGRQAENCAEYLKKGSQVLVEGSLRLEKWETKEGEKRSKVKVVARAVQFQGKPKPAKKEEPKDEGKTVDDDGDDIPF